MNSQNPQESWLEAKRRKQALSGHVQSAAKTATLVPTIAPAHQYLEKPFMDWVKQKVEAEPYWFAEEIKVLPGFYSNGWSNPRLEKLPYFGLPEDLTGKRVLDMGF